MTIYGTGGNDALVGTSDADFIDGLVGDDSLYGLAGNDTLWGSMDRDFLSGGTGNDHLDGATGNDTLDGGTGNDTLHGGEGNDTYLFATGDGMDTVQYEPQAGYAGTIAFTDVRSTEVTLLRQSNSLNLILGYGLGDQLTVPYFNTVGSRIEQFRFSDGVIWYEADIKRRVITNGTSGNDHLDGYNDGPNHTYGLDGNDALNGGYGDDEIDGGAGKDTLSGAGGADTLIGGSGDDNLLSGQAFDSASGTWLPDTQGDSLDGGAGNDWVYAGSGNDTMNGGTGNDSLIGGEGNDTYLFATGAGTDTVIDYDATTGNVDTIRFADVPSTDIALLRLSDGLILTYGTSDRLTVSDYFFNLSYRIEQFEFSDGVTWDDAAIKSRVVTYGTPGNDYLFGYTDGPNRIYGLDGNDALYGGNGNDELDGGPGNDTINAYSGNDTLNGGTGNDSLYGGEGNDTYLFATGDGVDTVQDLDATSGNVDTIQFSDVRSTDVTLFRQSDNLILVYGISDQLTISNYFNNAGSRIEQFKFSDGATWDDAAIKSRFVADGTSGDSGAAGAVEPPDLVAPTVLITDNLAGVANASTTSVVYTLTFSEPVLGLGGSDFILTNVAGGAVSGSGTTWTVTLIPRAGVSGGSMGLTLKAGAVTDLAGNPNAAASNNSQAIDTALPVAPKLVTSSSFHPVVDPQVTFHTTLGDVVLELNPTQAPVTVADVLAYVDTDYYNGTLFHRVVPGFVAQGGGFASGLVFKAPTYAPIVLESNNGLLNVRGAVAMARSATPDSATSQFFVNLVDNAFLNYSSAANPGYAVFGRVVAGMSVIDSMALIPTSTIGSHANVPQTEIVVSSAEQTVAGRSTTTSAVFQVQGLEVGATWEYSLNRGNTWIAGSGSSITLSAGSYAANAIQVRQTDAAGNLSAAGHYGSALAIDTTTPSVWTFGPADDAANVDVTSNIAFVFSEAVQRGTGNIVLKEANGTVIATYDAATSGNLSISANTLMIDPSADLGLSTGYRVEFAPGSIKDLAGNNYAGTTSYNFTTAAQTISGQAIGGGDGADSLTGTAGNDTVAGGAGIDSYTFTGNRSQYILTATATGYRAQDSTPGRDGADLLSAVEILSFADSTVDLTMAQRAAEIAASDLKTLEELYAGFFNRIPEAAGLAYWIGQVDSGVSLRQVADQFYAAGIQFGVYSANMTEAEFITAIYANVLGRSGVNAPNNDEIGYWQGWLHTGDNSKGAMVLQMLSDSHNFFTGDANVGWVIDLLDNKAEVADYFAVQQGLSYTDPQTNIARGIEIAAAITPTDTSAAIALIGVNEFST